MGGTSSTPHMPAQPPLSTPYAVHRLCYYASEGVYALEQAAGAV